MGLWILLGLVPTVFFLYEKFHVPAGAPPLAQSLPMLPPGTVPAGPVVTPGAPAGNVFPIPNATSFTTGVVSDSGLGVTVAAFAPDTRQGMANALSAREWRVVSTSPSGQILGIAPPNAENAGNLDALSAVRLASQGGFNVFGDADLAQKLMGGPDAIDPTTTATFLALTLGLPSPDPATDDGSGSGMEQTALNPATAAEALTDDFAFGSRFVLFVPAGVQV